MATYPAFPQHRSSTARLRDDIEIDRAGNGSVRARAFYTAPKWEFEAIHAALTHAERATLIAFYNTNRLLPVDYASDHTRATHSCVMDGPPEFIALGAGLFRARTKLVER